MRKREVLIETRRGISELVKSVTLHKLLRVLD